MKIVMLSVLIVALILVALALAFVVYVAIATIRDGRDAAREHKQAKKYKHRGKR